VLHPGGCHGPPDVEREQERHAMVPARSLDAAAVEVRFFGPMQRGAEEKAGELRPTPEKTESPIQGRVSCGPPQARFQARGTHLRVRSREGAISPV
jgi:hypothetical protein